MELDHLKNIWQKNTEAHVHLPAKGNEEIKAMLRKKAGGILHQVQKNFLWDAAVFTPISLLMVIIVLISSRPDASTFWACGVLVVYTVVFYWKVQQFMQNKLSSNLYDSLHQAIARLAKMQQVYLRLLLPVFPMVFMTKLLVFKLINQSLWTYDTHDLFFVSMALLIPLIVYQPICWLIHHFYGKHIQRLQNCLQEYQAQEKI